VYVVFTSTKNFINKNKTSCS